MTLLVTVYYFCPIYLPVAPMLTILVLQIKVLIRLISICLVTWFHFEVKYPFTEDEKLRVNKDDSGNQSAEYEWFKMGFATTWRAPDQHTVICFNASKWMKDILRQRLDSGTTSEDLSDPYWVHLILIECVVICYNKSIWNLRDKVRVYEEVCIISSLYTCRSGISWVRAPIISQLINQCPY